MANILFNIHNLYGEEMKEGKNSKTMQHREIQFEFIFSVRLYETISHTHQNV